MLLTIEEAKARLEKDIEKANELYQRRVDAIRFAESSKSEPRGRDWPRYLRAATLRNEGKTLSEIGADLGLSVQRVQQMIVFLGRRSRYTHPPQSTLSIAEKEFWDQIGELGIDCTKY